MASEAFVHVDWESRKPPSYLKKFLRESSLIPLTKLINAPNRSIKILWATFSFLMCVVLIACTILAVNQYNKHQTVFQANYGGDDDELPKNEFAPSVTLCYNTETMERIFLKQFQKNFPLAKSLTPRLPWRDPAIKPYFNLIANGSNLSSFTYKLPDGVMTWQSQLARSPFHRFLGNYNVTVNVFPGNENYTLEVIEQLPRWPSFLCLTVSVLKRFKTENFDTISYTVSNEPLENTTVSDTYSMNALIHSYMSFPFSNYHEFLNEELLQGRSRYIFLSTTQIRRISRYHQPCRSNERIEIFKVRYVYSRTACFWQTCCLRTRMICNCTCMMDLLGAQNDPCDPECEARVCPRNHGTEVCPHACVSETFVNHNTISMETLKPSQNNLIITKSTGTKILQEQEIYSLIKLFSEIGGICSLFIGFTCIFLFEIFEAVILWFSRNSLSIKEKDSKKSGVVNNASAATTEWMRFTASIPLHCDRNFSSNCKENGYFQGTCNIDFAHHTNKEIDPLVQLIREQKVKVILRFETQEASTAHDNDGQSS